MFHFLIFCDILLYLCFVIFFLLFFFFFKQKTAYEMRISDWSSDVCSSDLVAITSPNSAALSSHSTTRVEGSLLARIACHQPNSPFVRANSLSAMTQDVPSNRTASPSTMKFTSGFVIGSGSRMWTIPS